MRIYPLAVMALMLALGAVLAWLSPVYWEAPQPASILCAVVTGAGLVLLAVAAVSFRRRGTTVNPTKRPEILVTGGVYRLSRNPMYLGMLMILTGFPVLTGFAPGLLFAALFFLLMDRRVIPAEEEAAEAVFGESYRVYKSRTRRWL